MFTQYEAVVGHRICSDLFLISIHTCGNDNQIYLRFFRPIRNPQGQFSYLMSVSK